MKVLTILTLVLAFCTVWAKVRKHGKQHGEKQHDEHSGRLREHSKLLKWKAHAKTVKHSRHGVGKVHSRIYKKYGMFTAPGNALEDNSVLQSQDQIEQQPAQQMMVPVSSAGLTQPSYPEMVSSYSSTPTQPSAVNTEVAGNQDDGTVQAVPNTGGQSATVQFQGGQLATPVSAEPKVATQETAEEQTVPGGTNAETVDPNAGSDGTESFVQQNGGKEDETKGLEVYNGALPDGGQSKPQLDGVSPQEEVKVVNLGDDDKMSNEQDRACGGCPPGAKCVDGQCQIREEDAQAQGLTGKGTANNPGTVSDIHNLESQELKGLLKDASALDPPPGASPETSAGYTGTSTTGTETQGNLQQQTPALEQDQQQQQQQQQQDQMQADLPQTTSAPPKPIHQPPPLQPHFSGNQIKELRDFARMYKMYQFIRKIEQRLNDPDCAPICHKICKNFCPAKCCRKHNISQSAILAQTANSLVSGKPIQNEAHEHKVDASLMEDDEEEDKEEKEMNATPGKKHLFVKIVKNNALDRPRSHIRESV